MAKNKGKYIYMMVKVALVSKRINKKILDFYNG